MKDAQAKLLDSLLLSLPAEDRTLARIVTPKAPTEVMDGERADVRRVVDHDRGNRPRRRDRHRPRHERPPDGQSLWRKRAKDGPLAGIKAKTQYPKRPDGWQDDEWRPDTVVQLIQAGMLQGKSVGFVRLRATPRVRSKSQPTPPWPKCPA